MLKMILVGGMALSILCFFMAQNGIQRNTDYGNKYYNLKTKYGPPPPSEEFDDYPTPLVNSVSTTTEPYFRIILSKKANTPSTTPKDSSSTSTTQVTEDYNDIYNDDYKVGDLNETLIKELERLLYPDDNGNMVKMQNPSKINFKTKTTSPFTTITPSLPQNTTPHWSRLIPENITEINSPISNPHQSPNAAVSTATTPLTPLTSIVTKVIFETTTVNSPETVTTHKTSGGFTNFPISPNLIGRQDDFQMVTESAIDSQGLHRSTKLFHENAFAKPVTASGMEESLTESTIKSEDLSYLPPSPPPAPSMSISLPESMSRTINLHDKSNSNVSELQRNVSQPSRLYLPPKQN